MTEKLSIAEVIDDFVTGKLDPWLQSAVGIHHAEPEQDIEIAETFALLLKRHIISRLKELRAAGISGQVFTEMLVEKFLEESDVGLE